MPSPFRGSGQHQGLWCRLERLWFWMTAGPHTIWGGPSWGPAAGMLAEPCTKPHGGCWSWLGLPVPTSRPPQGRSCPTSLLSSGLALLALASFHHPIRGPCANPLHRTSPQLHRMSHEEKQTWKDTARGPSSTETWRMRRKTNPTAQSSRVESWESYTIFFFQGCKDLYFFNIQWGDTDFKKLEKRAEVNVSPQPHCPKPPTT